MIVDSSLFYYTALTNKYTWCPLPMVFSAYILFLRFNNKIIIMLLGSNKLSIVGSKGQWLSLTDPKTYHQYLCQEFLLDNQSLCQEYFSIIQQKHEEMVEVVHYNQTQASTFLILIRPFDTTLADLIPRAGTFRNEDLINTLEVVLGLLDKLRGKGKEYGMLSLETICFYNGQVKLSYGLQTPRKQNQTALETDLLSLGNIMLELAIGPNSSKGLLKRVQQQYSKRLFDVIACLVEDVGSRRMNAFDLIKEQVPKPALIEASNKETECTFQYFKNKINRVDDVVNQKLQKIKKMMLRGEAKGKKNPIQLQ